MPEVPPVETQLFGLFPPDFLSDGPVAATIEELQRALPPPESIGPTRIRDARHLQSESPLATAEFFDRHGFVLLSHRSAVRDWDLDPSAPEASRELVRLYQPEAEALVRSQLLPGRRIEVYQGTPERRGPGTRNPDYGTGVHQDPT
jgi:hypothetical protein